MYPFTAYNKMMLRLLFLGLTAFAQEMPKYGTEQWVKAAELVIDKYVCGLVHY